MHARPRDVLRGQRGCGGSVGSCGVVVAVGDEAWGASVAGPAVECGSEDGEVEVCSEVVAEFVDGAGELALDGVADGGGELAGPGGDEGVAVGSGDGGGREFGEPRVGALVCGCACARA